ncbi:MAG: DNA-binding protein WhiA [Oscillospiraceae bacterium]|nr:DNA-binding protein WhiA [Oscillospiraceae bacterium]
MSFSSEVKTELCREPVNDPELALAEAYGILLFCNQYTADGLRIVTESAAFAERIPPLFQKAFGVAFDRSPEAQNGGRLIFEIVQREKLTRLLDACGYDARMLISMHLNFGLLETGKARLAFLRGAFLAGGSVTDPEKRYHLELSTSHAAVSREILSVLEECGFRGKTALRNGNYLIYFKQGSEIARLLAALGALEAGERVNTAREQKVSVNKANRRSNCDLANVDKTVAAAQEQLAAIRQLEDAKGLDILPEKLREAALLRRDNPELSLTQLGELCDPPVTKSSFRYRLKKLMELVPDSTNH